MQQGVFLEFVRRNPGKESLARMPPFRENVQDDAIECIEALGRARPDPFTGRKAFPASAPNQRLRPLRALRA